MRHITTRMETRNIDGPDEAPKFQAPAHVDVVRREGREALALAPGPVTWRERRADDQEQR